MTADSRTARLAAGISKGGQSRYALSSTASRVIRHPTRFSRLLRAPTIGEVKRMVVCVMFSQQGAGDRVLSVNEAARIVRRNGHGAVAGAMCRVSFEAYSLTWRIFEAHAATCLVRKGMRMWPKRDREQEPTEWNGGESLSEASPGEQSLPAPVVQPRELALLGEARRMIQEASSLDEIKGIRDKAEAARKYVESAQLGLALQNHAAEVKLRAERKAGELLAKLKLPGGNRRLTNSGDGPSLDDLGITKHQSSRWQREAAVPEETFERFVRETNNASQELTTAALLRLARQVSSIRRAKRAVSNGEKDSGGALASIDELLVEGRRFACIYADPHVRFGDVLVDAEGESQRLTIEQLCTLPVRELAEDDAHLHLWVKNEWLFDAPQVMEAWGFVFRSVLAWVKPQRGAGEYWRQSHELLLLGVRGELPFCDRSVMSWFRANRLPHGRKSEKARKLIERVSPGPYLELFARSRAKGWEVVGNDIGRIN